MKNQITFLILFILLNFCSLQAQVTQEWVQIYNGPGNNDDRAISLAVDNSGNIYVTGTSGGDYATIKYNSSGVQLWIKRYDVGWDNASSLAIDDSGNVYVTGTSGGDYATIKYNSSGVQLWIERYNGPGNGSDYAHSLEVDNSGNVYVTGTSGGAYATIKYNSLGVQQWIQRYHGGNATSLGVDNSGNVYVTGSTYDSLEISYYTTIKYNSSGIQQWIHSYISGGFDIFAPSLAVDNYGNVYITGYEVGIGTSSDYVTIKYKSSGIQQWVQRYNGEGNGGDIASTITVDNSENIYVTGGSDGIGTGSDYATIKYNSLGVRQWVQRYNGPGNIADYPKSLAVDGYGNVYVTGGSTGSGIDDDYATIKYNSSGVQLWVQIFNGPGNSYDNASSLTVDGSGNVYVTGSTGSGTGSDYATIKYSQTDGITAPSNLIAQSVDSSFIKVNWQDNSNDEDGFYIERTQINDSSHWEVIDVVPQNVIQYSDYFVTRSLKYFYRVKAYSENTFSEYSNIDSAVLGGNPSFIPAPPSKLMLLKRTKNAVQMGWLDNSGNENGFIIFRKTEGDLFFEIIDSVSTDVVTYQEVGVNPNLNYSYKICSYNSYGISDFSNTLIVLAKSGRFIRTSELSDDHILLGKLSKSF